MTGVDPADEQLSEGDIRALGRAIVGLRQEVRTLNHGVKRSRVANVVLSLVVAAVIALGTLYYLDVLNRRKESAEATRQLACTVVAYFPPGRSVLIDSLRAQYDCPAYKPPTPAPTPTRTP